MRQRVLELALVLAAASAPARAGDDPEPAYADKPASWWIGEFLGGEDSHAASAVLKRMGDAAVPAIVARLAKAEDQRDRTKLLDLLLTGKTLPPAALPALPPIFAGGSANELSLALRIVGRAGPAASQFADDAAALLRSPFPSVRRLASYALGELDEAAGPYIPDLVALLESDADSAIDAVGALGRLGEHASTGLPAMLAFAAGRAPHPSIVRALAALGPDDSRVADEIVRAIETGDERARSAALGTLLDAKRPGDAILSVATRLAGSKDRNVRSASAAGLGRFAFARRQFPEALFVLLGDDDIGVVGTAAAGLEACAARDHSFAARVGDVWLESPHPRAITRLMLELRPESGPALLEAALSDRAELRSEAWRALVRVGEGGIAVPAETLQRMLFDTRIDAETRADVLGRVLSLRMLPEGTFEATCAALVTEGDAPIAIRALGHLGRDDGGRAALLAATARPEAKLRAAAIHSTSSLIAKYEEVRAACARALDDPDEAVRAAALRLIAGCGAEPWIAPGAARSALAARVATLPRTTLDDRRAVIAILSNFPDDARPAAPLVPLLADDFLADQVVQLLLRSPGEGLDAFRALVAGDDPLLAARAARVLISRRGDAAVAARLPAWIDSGDRRVAREAVLAAAQLPPDAITAMGGVLIRAALAGEDGVAYPACHALAGIAQREPAAHDALLAVAGDPANAAQLDVTPLLPNLGRAGMKRLVALLDHENRAARRNACVVFLGAAQRRLPGCEAATDSLVRISTEDDLELARFARQALAALRE